MEQDSGNINVDGLMYVIKEDYAVKSKNNKWIAGLFCLIIAVNLIDSILDYTTMTEFFKSMFAQTIMVLLLLVVILKNIYCYRKISECKTPDVLLATYRKNMKLDKIMLCVFMPLYLVLFYVRFGCDVFFWILLALFGVFFCFYFFGRSLKDKNIEELSHLVEQEVDSSESNV